jgi:hypothetical protein
VVGIAILQLVPQTLEIGLIELRNLDLGELDLPLVVLDDIFDLVLQLIVVLLDLLQSGFLIALQIFVDLQDALDLLLLYRDDVL